VQGYGGDIRVRSAAGQGSVFQVFLLSDPTPASDADAA
jgi:signal transduction histidine kinase